MSISLLDRLGGTVCEARGGALVLARYVVPPLPAGNSS